MELISQDDILLLTDIIDDEVVQSKEAKIWAYYGVVGGVGVSSLAVQTAYELSQLQKDKSVCLIDLDFERGACAPYLDIVPSINLADLNAAVGRMDEDLAATFIGTYKNKFSVISVQGEIGGNDNVDADALLSLLDSICGMYDFIILDIPPMWRSWTQAVIGAADEFALVTEMRVPALHRTRKLSDFISKAMDLETAPHVVINKYERRVLKDSINLKSAETVLGRAVCGNICADEDTLRSAINCGKPAGMVNSDARYVKSVRSHVHVWLGQEEVCETPPVSLFHRKSKRSPKQDRRDVRKRA